MAISWLNRVPTYPNRYKLTKSDGSYEYVTLTRADEPSVEGTPLNAENLNAMQGEISDAVTAANNAQTKANSAYTTASNAATAAANAQGTANGAKNTADTANNNINKLITDITAIKYVTSLPSNPDATTLYLIKK